MALRRAACTVVPRVHLPLPATVVRVRKQWSAVPRRGVLTWLRDASLNAAVAVTDRTLSRRLPRGAKLVAKALADIAAVAPFSVRDITLALLLLWRMQTGTRRGGTLPSLDLAALEETMRAGVMHVQGPSSPPLAHTQTPTLSLAHNTHVRAVPIDDAARVATIYRMLQYCNAAYCADDASACSALSLPGSALCASRWIADADRLLPAFFVARDDKLETIVVCVRGTWSLGDALINFAAAPEHFAGGTVHGGMLAAAKQLDRHLRTCVGIEALLAKNPEYSLTFVGHSMAGAVAALLATMYKVQYPHARAHAFSPASCMSRTVAASCEPYTWSYINGDDVVPRFHLDSAIRMQQALVNASVQQHILQALQLEGVLTTPAVAALSRTLSGAGSVLVTSAAQVTSSVTGWLRASTPTVAASATPQAGDAALPNDETNATEQGGSVAPGLLGTVARAAVGLRAQAFGLGANAVARLVDAGVATATHSAASTNNHLHRLRADGRHGHRHDRHDHETQAQVQGSMQELLRTMDSPPASTSASYVLHDPTDDEHPRLSSTGKQYSNGSKQPSNTYVLADVAVEEEPVDAADPYGASEGHEALVSRDFTLDESGPSLVAAASSTSVAASALSGSYVLRDGDAGEDETVHAFAAAQHEDVVSPSAAAPNPQALQYYPPGRVYYLAYPSDYVRVVKRKPAAPPAAGVVPSTSSPADVYVMESDEDWNLEDPATLALATSDREEEGTTAEVDEDAHDEPDPTEVSQAFRGTMLQADDHPRQWTGARLGLSQTRHRPKHRKHHDAGHTTQSGYHGPVLFEFHNADTGAPSGEPGPVVPLGDTGASVQLDDRRLFSHIVLSDNMITDHLVGSFEAELRGWLEHLKRREAAQPAARADHAPKAVGHGSPFAHEHPDTWMDEADEHVIADAGTTSSEARA